jgi:2-polyprenyl-3-methyl-5-hydroxy-6-metoxy-1,4-benzoquinol methylase
MSQAVRQTHLEFYRQHQITPVRYDLSSMDAHLERRFALYAKLGLPPVSFKNAKVLEIAAGTGHNSLYISQLLPAQLTLLEPNEVAVEYIRKTYQSFERPHTSPELITKMIEDFSSEEFFDIVLCENWLGCSDHELSLLKKISGMVAPQGMLVLTTIAPIGFVPNVLRRFMSSYLAPLHKDFQERTELLVSAFGSHLATMAAMTRNPVDWVQDNMINPAYFGLCLSIPLLLEQVGARFEALGSSPAFSEDWRWFKSLHGQQGRFNQQFLDEYWKKAHNLIDYRETPTVGETRGNLELEKKALQLLGAVAHHEEGYLKQGDFVAAAKEVHYLLAELLDLIPKHLARVIAGLREALSLIQVPGSITGPAVAKMTEFNGLFGRETVYVSLIRMK